MPPRASGTATSGTAARRSATPWPSRCARSRAYSTFQDLTNPAVVGAGRSGRRDRPDGRCEGVPDERRVRFDRHGDQDGAALLAARRAARAHDPAPARARVPRDARRRARRWPGSRANAAGYGPLLPDVEEVAWDDADALRATIERLGADRVAAFFCEPVIGAGGVYAPPPGYLEAGARGLPRDRRAVRRRRGDHRVRTDRRVVRQHPLGARARPRDLREGHHERVPAARRGAGGADRLGAVLRRGRGDVPPRLHLLGPRGGRGGGAGEPRHHGAATTSWRGPSSWRRTSPRALRPLADHELVSEVRAGTGVLAAVQLDPERAARRRRLGRPGRCRRAAKNGIMTQDARDRRDPDLAAARARRRRGRRAGRRPRGRARRDRIGDADRDPDRGQEPRVPGGRDPRGGPGADRTRGTR